MVAPVNTAITETDLQQFLTWLTRAGIETAFGLIVIAAVAAAISYLVSAWIWRAVVARKWRRRHLRRQHRDPIPAD